MEKTTNFIEGKIFAPLIKFTLPILLAMFLQVMYGAVDLLIVGQFGHASDVSAVATGSHIMQTITSVIIGVAMGITILVGQLIGKKRLEEAGNAIGSGICIFAVLTIILTTIMFISASPMSHIMNAPKEAFDSTVLYVKLCSAGLIFIIAYNVLGSVFRGLGDSKTPLITVLISCIVNIIGDLILVGIFNMAAKGAAIATVFAQAISVLLSLVIIKKQGLPFKFNRKSIRFHKGLTSQILKFGMPIALQDFLVSVSFLVITAIVNSLGLIPSAGVGVAQKLTGFIMLVPSSLSQAVSSFVAQNYGAGKIDRAKKALVYAIALSFGFGIFMFSFSFFRGDLIASIFSNETSVVLAAWDYMKAYAIDCLFTAFMFCMTGFFTGCGKTTFVMVQGIIGAFCIRIPVSYFMSKITPVSLFRVGLATPASTIVQIILCLIYMAILTKNLNQNQYSKL